MRYATLAWVCIWSLSSVLAYAEEDSVESITEDVPAAVAAEEVNRDLDNYRNVHPELYKDSCWHAAEPQTDCEYARSHNLWGVWFPEGPPLFRPFLADPRQLTYSVGWRFNDRATVQNVIDVSFGDIFPVFRWCDIWCMHGDLEVDLEGGVWAIFDPLHESSPLIDADYYVGVPVTYAFGDWAIRFRGYHISTHIGDEFLLDHPHFNRRNPSIEALDLCVSWQFLEELRLYSGVGWVCCQDDSFRCGEFYALAGFELRLFQLGYRDYCNRLYGVPFFGAHFFYQSHFKRHINATYVLGWEWGKVSCLRRRLRFFLEYHDGYSLDGQFCKCPTHYISIRGSYGF